MVRERTGGSKLEGKFKKKVGKVVKESPHTITFLPKHAKKEVIYSKRGVAKPNLSKENPKEKKEEKAGPSTSWKILEGSSEDETYVPTEEEETPTSAATSSHTVQSDIAEEEATEGAVAEAEETAAIQEKAVNQETPARQEEEDPGTQAPKEKEETTPLQSPKQCKRKAVKASVEWTPPERKTRRRRPTERYGINVIMQVDGEEEK